MKYPKIGPLSRVNISLITNAIIMVLRVELIKYFILIFEQNITIIHYYHRKTTSPGEWAIEWIKIFPMISEQNLFP